MKYKLDLIARQTIEVDAATPQEAILLTKEKYPHYRCDFISNEDESENHCIEICESCRKEVLDIDVHSTNDDETQHYCEECSIALWGDKT